MAILHIDQERRYRSALLAFSTERCVCCMGSQGYYQICGRAVPGCRISGRTTSVYVVSASDVHVDLTDFISAAMPLKNSYS